MIHRFIWRSHLWSMMDRGKIQLLYWFKSVYIRNASLFSSSLNLLFSLYVCPFFRESSPWTTQPVMLGPRYVLKRGEMPFGLLTNSSPNQDAAWGDCWNRGKRSITFRVTLPLACLPLFHFLLLWNGVLIVGRSLLVSEGESPLGWHRCKWGDNIKVELKDIEFTDVKMIKWLRIGSSDRVLWAIWWTFWFLKRREITVP